MMKNQIHACLFLFLCLHLFLSISAVVQNQPNDAQGHTKDETIISSTSRGVKGGSAGAGADGGGTNAVRPSPTKNTASSTSLLISAHAFFLTFPLLLGFPF
jgi:hypothetical protein